MKHLKLLLLILSGCVLLCGCQKTPEKVKENMEQYGENPQVGNTEITYCSVDELKNKNIPAINEGNLHITAGMDFSNIEAIDIVQLSLDPDFLTDANIEKYTKLFEINKNKLTEGEIGNSHDGRWLYYDNEAENKYMHISQNGGMVHNINHDFSTTLEKKYNLGKEDISETYISINDTSINLSDLCKNAEKWLDDNMHMDGLNYKVSDVHIRKPDNADSESRVASLWTEYEYKGIPFNDYTNNLMDDNQNEITIWAFTWLDYYDSLDIPSRFSRNYSFVINSSEPVEKVIDPESAVKILKDTMSGFGVLNISEALPLYVLYLKDSVPEPGAKIEARPVYAFLVKNNSAASGTFNDIIKMSYCEHFFFVDMVTGEVTTDLKK